MPRHGKIVGKSDWSEICHQWILHSWIWQLKNISFNLQISFILPSSFLATLKSKGFILRLCYWTLVSFNVFVYFRHKPLFYPHSTYFLKQRIKLIRELKDINHKITWKKTRLKPKTSSFPPKQNKTFSRQPWNNPIKIYYLNYTKTDLGLIKNQ